MLLLGDGQTGKTTLAQSVGAKPSPSKSAAQVAHTLKKHILDHFLLESMYEQNIKFLQCAKITSTDKLLSVIISDVGHFL